MNQTPDFSTEQEDPRSVYGLMCLGAQHSGVKKVKGLSVPSKPPYKALGKLHAQAHVPLQALALGVPAHAPHRHLKRHRFDAKVLGTLLENLTEKCSRDCTSSPTLFHSLTLP